MKYFVYATNAYHSVKRTFYKRVFIDEALLANKMKPDMLHMQSSLVSEMNLY
jgi:hypothetical protein